VGPLACVLVAVAGCGGSSGYEDVPSDRLSATARYPQGQVLTFIKDRLACVEKSSAPGSGDDGILGEFFCSDSAYGPLRITLFTDRVTSQFIDEYREGRCGTNAGSLYVAGANWLITPATERGDRTTREMAAALGVDASSFCSPAR
jgi:hypothetical protein